MAKDKKKVIDKLTPDQEAQLPVYVERYKAIGLDTKPTDKQLAETYLKAAYDYYCKKTGHKYTDLEFIWAPNPFEGAKIAAMHLKGDTEVTPEEVRDMANHAVYGSFEAYWVVQYAYIAEVLLVESDELISIIQNIIAECGVYWTFEDLVVVSPKPSEIHMKDGKLHNLEGLALAYPDQTGIYAVDGATKTSLMEVVFCGRNEGSDSKESA